MMRLKRIIPLILLVSSISVKASEQPPLCIIGDTQTALQIRCTCYTDNGKTASGLNVREGVIAGRKEWLGRTCALYSISENGGVGEFIGFYEFNDTGNGIDTDGDGKGDSLKKGLSVDVWVPTKKDAQTWVNTYGDYVYLQFTGGKG